MLINSHFFCKNNCVEIIVISKNEGNSATVTVDYSVRRFFLGFHRMGFMKENVKSVYSGRGWKEKIKADAIKAATNSLESETQNDNS